MTLTDQFLRWRMQTEVTPTLNLRTADPADFEAVATLFEALHQFNASLDPRFGLADNWRAGRFPGSPLPF